jgi:hypothetical protein
MNDSTPPEAQSTSTAGSSSFQDCVFGIEFGCWCVLALVPILHFCNGDAVTDDQRVFQGCLFVASLAAGLGLRLYTLTGAGTQRRGPSAISNQESGG